MLFNSLLFLSCFFIMLPVAYFFKFACNILTCICVYPHFCVVYFHQSAKSLARQRALLPFLTTSRHCAYCACAWVFILLYVINLIYIWPIWLKLGYVSLAVGFDCLKDEPLQDEPLLDVLIPFKCPVLCWFLIAIRVIFN